MEVKHLEYFITVAELGSINKAAQALFISQPRLGKIIKDLEESMGTVLFYRTRHGVKLTPDGEEFLIGAMRVKNDMENLLNLSHGIHPGESSLKVSMTKFSHILECYMDVILRHKEESAFCHRLDEGSPEEVIEDVAASRADIGVLNFDSFRHKQIVASMEEKGLVYRELAMFKPHILLATNHPLLLKGEPVNLHSLKEYGFVRYLGQYEDFTYRIFSDGGEHNLNRSAKIIYVSSRSALLRMISNSDFYGIGIHDFSVQESSYQVKSVPVEGCEGMLEFGYITHAHVELTPIMREFIGELEKSFKITERE